MMHSNKFADDFLEATVTVSPVLQYSRRGQDAMLQSLKPMQ